MPLNTEKLEVFFIMGEVNHEASTTNIQISSDKICRKGAATCANNSTAQYIISVRFLLEIPRLV